jgi:hypothetical protein
MPTKDELYYQCVVGVGIFLTADGLSHFAPVDFQKFFAYLALSVLAAAGKFRLPGMSVTVSPVFAFVLIGIANFSMGEAVVIGCLAALGQSLWRPREKCSARKTVFSVAAVSIGVMAAYNPAHYFLRQGVRSAPAMLPLAMLVFFTVNTGLVCGMVALVAEAPFQQVCRKVTRHLFGYYVVGGSLAALVIVCDRWWGWRSGILFVPFLYLAGNHYRARWGPTAGT